MYAKMTAIGRVGQDVEMKTTTTGTLIGSSSIAVTEKRKGKEDGTVWYRVSFFGKLAEIAQKYVSKGALIFVEGEPAFSAWIGRDGLAKVTPEIKANVLKILTWKQTDGASTPAPGGTPKGGKPDPWHDVKEAGFVPEDEGEDVPL